MSPDTCLLFFLSETGRDAELQVLAEMKELGGATIAVCNHADATIRGASDLVMEAGVEGHELALLAPFVVAGQLLGLFYRREKGSRCGPSEKSDARCDSRLSFRESNLWLRSTLA